MTAEIPDVEAELQAVATRAAAHWDQRDPADYQSQRLRGLSAGTITDWGLSGDGRSTRVPGRVQAGG